MDHNYISNIAIFVDTHSFAVFSLYPLFVFSMLTVLVNWCFPSFELPFRQRDCIMDKLPGNVFLYLNVTDNKLSRVGSINKQFYIWVWFTGIQQYYAETKRCFIDFCPYSVKENISHTSCSELDIARVSFSRQQLSNINTHGYHYGCVSIIYVFGLDNIWALFKPSNSGRARISNIFVNQWDVVIRLFINLSLWNWRWYQVWISNYITQKTVLVNTRTCHHLSLSPQNWP